MKNLHPRLALVDASRDSAGRNQQVRRRLKCMSMAAATANRRLASQHCHHLRRRASAWTQSSRIRADVGGEDYWYSAQSPAPIPPSRTHSSDYSGKSGHNSAGGSGDSRGGLTHKCPRPRRAQSRNWAGHLRQVGALFASNATEDSFARDKCQICGHEWCRPPAVGMPSCYVLKLNCNL